MGGSNPSAPPPPAPAASVGETSAQAIQAQIDAQPRILAAQQQYGPQFSQLNLEQLQKYGPGFAQAALDLQRKFGPQFAQVERDLAPELAGAQRTLSEFLSGTDESEFQALRPGLLEDVRGAQSQRGLGAISPLGSVDESVQLQRLKQSLKDRRINVALSTAGRVPIGGIPQIQGQTGAPQQIIQGPSSSDLFGYQQNLNAFNSSIFGTQSNIFGTQQTAATARRGQNLDFVSDVIGGGAAAYGSYAGLAALCWVASEVFGGWYEPKTIGARFYVNFIAPKWFKNLYIKFGQNIAKFISDKPVIKNMIKPIFEKFSEIGWRKING